MSLNYDKISVSNDGSMYYTLNDKLHRLDGPAIICPDGKVWYENGKILKSKLNDRIIYYSNGIPVKENDISVLVAKNKHISIYYYNGLYHLDYSRFFDGTKIDITNYHSIYFSGNRREMIEHLNKINKLDLLKELLEFSEKKCQ